MALVAGLPLLLLLLAVDRAPRTEGAVPPDATAAALTRDLALTLEAAAQGGRLVLRADEINAALAAAGRLVPGTRGVVAMRPGAADLRLAIGAPVLPEGLWLNLRLGLVAAEDGLRPGAVRIGRLPLPRALVLPAVRALIDRTLGAGLGADLIDGVGRVAIEPPVLEIDLALDPATRTALAEALRTRAQGRSAPVDPQRVRVHRYHLDRQGDAGTLPRSGSALPYLRHAVETAYRLGRDAPEAELRAGLFALTLYCGEGETFGRLIGVTLPATMAGADNHCAGTTLGGRVDLRRHFVVSAGLQAASSARIAFGAGELKEILDSGDGGSGFSFDDIAANLAGARFAEVLLATPRADWPALVARMESEADLLPALDDLPRGLDEAAFRDRFGDVESPAYAAMVREIAGRIEALPFFAGAAGG